MRWSYAGVCVFVFGCSATSNGSAPSEPSGGNAGLAGSAGAPSASGASAGTGAGLGGSTSLGGTTGSGGSTPGSGGTGQGGAYSPPKCDGTIPDLPSGAPVLTPGVLKDIGAIPFYYANGIVFEACNPAVLYSAGGNYPASGGPGDKHGVFRSTDAGSTWTQLVSLDSSARVRVNPKDPNDLYVIDGVNGSTHGFWRSTDAGKTWEVPQGFKDLAYSKDINCDDSYDVEPDPADFKHVLVTFHNPWAAYDYASGIFESTDGGDTWIAHPPEAAWKGGYGYNAFFLHEPSQGIGNAQTWLFTSQSGGYFRTTDSGGTWTQVSDQGQAHGGAQHLYTKAGVLYVTTRTGLVKSTDNGASFSVVLPTGNTFSQFLGVGSDGEHLYAAGSTGGDLLTASLSDDSKWTKYGSVTFPSAGPYEMNFDSAHGILYSANANGGLWALKLQ